MDYLTKIYKEECKKNFSKYGFKVYRNNHYRVVNDVFQSFELQKSVSGRECTVHFVVVPLCAGNVVSKTYCGPNHLKMFESNYTWFSYDKNDKISIEKCVDLLIKYIQKYLIPYFEAANDSYNAYYATCKFQLEHYKEGMFYADYYLFCMTLKTHMFDKSLEHLIAIKNHTENSYKTNKECFREKLSKEYENRMKKKLKEIDYQINMITQPNLEYISNFINESEKIALLNLGLIET